MFTRLVAAFVSSLLLCNVLFAADVTIHITGLGTAAKYIKEGDTEQKDVTVKVGQTVKWANDVMTNKTHTATCKDATGQVIFDTDDLVVGASKDVVMDRTLFVKAGGVAGSKVELNYVCARHPATMKSKIILDDTPDLKSLVAKARIVPRIVSVKLKVVGDPKSLDIDVTGEVPTAGYSDPQLVFAVYLVPPSDGIQDIYLFASAPTHDVSKNVSQIEAKTSWKDFGKDAPWLKGVRVHGVGSGVVEKMLP